MSDATATATATVAVPRLKQRYNDEVRAALKDELGLDNIMQVPRFEKIVINSGVGAALAQQSLLEGAVRDLEQITGQKVVVTKAKKSIAGFKLREGRSDLVVVPLLEARHGHGCGGVAHVRSPSHLRQMRTLVPSASNR